MLSFPIVESAGALLREMATFDSAGVARKERRVNDDFPPYPSGLRLAGPPGAGRRRRPRRAAPGPAADRRPAPTSSSSPRSPRRPSRAWPAPGRSPGTSAASTDGDVDEAWYVIAATDDAAVNERVSAECEAQRIFCVRADDAHPGHRLDARPSAGTPASPWRSSATGSPASPPRSATRSSPALRDGTDRRAARRRPHPRRRARRRRARATPSW